MRFEVKEDITNISICGGVLDDTLVVIKAGTIINLDPVEEVKVKAFVPSETEEYWYVDVDLGVADYEYKGDDTDRRMLKAGNCFRTKEDAQIAQAKVIELFNSFK